MLSIDQRPDGVVVVAGRLDASQVPAAQQLLDRLQGVVTLDCAGLEYISSAGLAALLRRRSASWPRRAGSGWSG
jgi:anti-anti-sigma factor